MLTKLKGRVQAALAVGAKTAHKIKLTPNRISGLGIILALLSAMSYAEWQSSIFCLPLAAILLLFSGLCDALDGVVARLYQQASAIGGFLDSLLDRYADAAVYIGIIVGGLCDTLWGLVALVGSLLVSYSRARAEAAGIKMETIGLAERAERIIILVIATFVAMFWLASSVMNASIVLLAVLSNLTVLQRSVYVYRHLRKKESN